MTRLHQRHSVMTSPSEPVLWLFTRVYGYDEVPLAFLSVTLADVQRFLGYIDRAKALATEIKAFRGFSVYEYSHWLEDREFLPEDRLDARCLVHPLGAFEDFLLGDNEFFFTWPYTTEKFWETGAAKTAFGLLLVSIDDIRWSAGLKYTDLTLETPNIGRARWQKAYELLKVKEK